MITQGAKRTPMNAATTATLLDTRTLSERWGVSARTVLRYCRLCGVPEVRFVPGGKIMFRTHDIAELEKQKFLRDK